MAIVLKKTIQSIHDVLKCRIKRIRTDAFYMCAVCDRLSHGDLKHLPGIKQISCNLKAKITQHQIREMKMPCHMKIPIQEPIISKMLKLELFPCSTLPMWDRTPSYILHIWYFRKNFHASVSFSNSKILFQNAFCFCNTFTRLALTYYIVFVLLGTSAIILISLLSKFVRQ